MTRELLMHPVTAAFIADYIASPVHAVLITGPAGSGKATICSYIAGRILRSKNLETDTLRAHPYVRIIAPVDMKAIPIEAIRELQHYLGLKVPGVSPESIARAVIIEDAHLLTVEAQNALLKTLEEPPVDTLIILSAVSPEAVLPTIRSRARLCAVLPPAAADITDYFITKGYGKQEIDKAILLSGGLMGLTAALLSDDADHPLVAATTQARGILQSTTYDRLLLVDGLSKQKQLSLDIVYVLGQMSRMALMKSKDTKSAQRWQKILRASYSAGELLTGNTQPKLVLMNLMLEL